MKKAGFARLFFMRCSRKVLAVARRCSHWSQRLAAFAGATALRQQAVFFSFSLLQGHFIL
jgi:hypothetical protein